MKPNGDDESQLLDFQFIFYVGLYERNVMTQTREETLSSMLSKTS